MQVKFVDAESGSEILADSFPVTIGRGDDSTICLNDRWTSRLHCEVVLEDDELWVHDLGSRHGIMVNGESVTKSRVNTGDTISVGLRQLQIEFASDDVEVAS